MKVRLSTLIILSLLITACNHTRKKVTTYPDTLANGKIIVLAGDYEASLLRLIATPERYDGKKIRVIGYLHLEFEGNGLYLHNEDYEYRVLKNAVWAEINVKHPESDTIKRFSNHYVIMEGTFDSHWNGHMGAYSGSIRDITRLELWPYPQIKQ